MRSWVSFILLNQCLDIDPFPAHRDAWEKGGVLHRDVSVGNIMINVEPGPDGKTQGFLTDWDICKWKEDLLKSRSATQPAGVSVCNGF